MILLEINEFTHILTVRIICFWAAELFCNCHHFVRGPLKLCWLDSFKVNGSGNIAFQGQGYAIYTLFVFQVGYEVLMIVLLWSFHATGPA